MHDAVALQPPPVFHISAELLMAHCKMQRHLRVLHYLMLRVVIGSFTNVNGILTSRWRLPCTDVPNDYSCYFHNSVEFGWHVEDVLNGDATFATTQSVFENAQHIFIQWVGATELDHLHPVPTGVCTYQPTLLRGANWKGLYDPTITLYDKWILLFYSRPVDQGAHNQHTDHEINGRPW